jgi:peptidoglycan/LPS O-acetylase OafA/YrhL
MSPFQKTYFPGFNGLRALAALGIIIHHAEEFKAEAKLPHAWNNAFIHSLGSSGVDLFFVLSGFLITHLLLKEQKQVHHISVRRFYLRRVLRILPLYFLTVFIAFVIGPRIPTPSNLPVDHFIRYWENGIQVHYVHLLMLYLLMVPNVARLSLPPVLFATQCWSIGIEEQFYLGWPWIVKSCRRFWIKALLLLLGGKWLLDMLLVRFGPDNSLGIAIITSFRLDCLALGGLAGSLLFMYRDRMHFGAVQRRLQRWTAPIIIVLLLTDGVVPYLRPLWPILYAGLLLNLAIGTAPTCLESPVLYQLGKISYGLYMVHILAIVLVLKMMQASQGPDLGILFQQHPVAWNLCYYGAVFLLTIAIAYASYVLFESRFLKLKDRFGSLSTQSPT